MTPNEKIIFRVLKVIIDYIVFHNCIQYADLVQAQREVGEILKSEE